MAEISGLDLHDDRALGVQRVELEVEMQRKDADG
jgi:hypothetical protein